MTRVAVIAALAACNQFYGITETGPIDAIYFDAPADAPYACPPQGAAPQFSPILQQRSTRDCRDFTESSAGIALAECDVAIEQADPMGEFGPAPIAPLPGFTQLFQPRIAPEGDELFIRQAAVGNPGVASVFRFDGQTWTHDRDLPIPAHFRLGTVSRGPARRMVVSTGTALAELDEASGWAQIGAYTASDLGVDSLYGASTLPNLSPDGTRLVFSGERAGVESRHFYITRNSIADRFAGPALSLADVPRQPLAAFLTADCSRIYFAALGVVFYLQQR